MNAYRFADNAACIANTADTVDEDNVEFIICIIGSANIAGIADISDNVNRRKNSSMECICSIKE